MKLPIREFNAVVIGAGGTGMRAALQISQSGQICALLSRMFLTRSHTVSTQSGITVVLGNTHEDSREWHVYDTVKGSDYVGNQDTVEYMCKTGPEAILELDHMGLSFSRLGNDTVYQRPFGGQSKNFGGEQAARTAAAADRTGHMLLHALYQQNLKDRTTIFSEWYALGLVKNADGTVVGRTAPCTETNEVVYPKVRVTVLVTDGVGRIYQSTTDARISTGDGVGMAIHVGAPVQDMKVWQFHLTDITGVDVLVAEGCRGEGGYLPNRHGEHLVRRYAPNAKDLTGRDVVVRSIVIEIREDRSCDGPWGLYAKLKLDHLGKEVLEPRLPDILELSRTFAHVDPIKEPVPVIPICHYMVGGIPTKVAGQALTVNERGEDVVIPGPLTVGEVACVSVHGVDRLSGDSLLDLVVFGRMVGLHLQESIAEQGDLLDVTEDEIDASLARLNRWSGNRNNEDPVTIHKVLQEYTQHNFSIFREDGAMAKGLEELKATRERLKNACLDDISSGFNTQHVECLELDNLMEIAHATAVSADFRTESRDVHNCLDFPEYDDENWLCRPLYLSESESMMRYQVNTEPKLYPAFPPKIRTC